MVSKLLRRSGVAVGLEASRLGWIPNFVIQVGIGQYHEGMHVLKEEWPDIRILGFEAHPGIAKKINDYPGEIREIAISDRCGDTVLFVKHRHKDGSSILPFPSDIKVSDNIPVKTSTLDKEISAADVFGKEVILWMDCEGSELRVLQGAENTLTHVKMVNVEMTPNTPSIHWPTPNELHSFLRDAGFYRQCLHTMKGGQYDAIYVKADIFQVKYCCCPYTVSQYEDDCK